MALLPGATARALYNAAVGTPPDTSAQASTTTFLNNALRAAALSKQPQIVFQTPNLAHVLNALYPTGLTLTTTTDLTPAYKNSIIGDLTLAGYLVSTNLDVTVITAVFPP